MPDSHFRESDETQTQPLDLYEHMYYHAPRPMSLSQFIRDNTNDGRNIASVLIDVMEGRLDGCKISHKLTAARLLTIYGYEDADDFIADNPASSSDVQGRRSGTWVEIDPILTTLIKIRTDDGRAIALFFIDVMEGRVEGIHVGHRVAAAKELLNRAFGKYQSRPLPKPPGSTAPKRQTHKTHQRVAKAQTQAVAAAPAASTPVLDEPEQQSEPETTDAAPVYIDTGDPLYIDEERLEFFEACYDPDFDPYEATRNENYAQSYTGCKDPDCGVHGNPPELEFDPNDYHY